MATKSTSKKSQSKSKPVSSKQAQAVADFMKSKMKSSGPKAPTPAQNPVTTANDTPDTDNDGD